MKFVIPKQIKIIYKDYLMENDPVNLDQVTHFQKSVWNVPSAENVYNDGQIGHAAITFFFPVMDTAQGKLVNLTWAFETEAERDQEFDKLTKLVNRWGSPRDRKCK